MKRYFSFLVLPVIAVVGFPGGALARSTLDVLYPAGDVWGATVRFLRVDNGYALREKDRDSGYILFDYTDGTKKVKAAVEVLGRRDRDGRDVTQLVASIPDLPKHIETLLLDKLGRKLREELGAPLAPPAKAKDRDRSDRDKDRDPDKDKDGAAKDGDKDKGDGLPRPVEGDLPRAPTTDKLPRAG